MKIISQHKIIASLCAAVFATAAAFLILRYPELLRAQEDPGWRSFSENRYGLVFDYPQGWSFDLAYDRYAKGLMNIDIVSRKCGRTANNCAADCIDIRIFSGGKPGRDSSQLFVQLYEDMLAVRDTDNPELVQKIDVDGRIVYKILNEAPTLSLNGSCPGPLYIFDSGMNKFIYIFAGYGADAKVSGEETVKRIISSIKANNN